MDELEEMDLDDVDNDNRTEFFYAYDHPVWEKYESVSKFPLLNSTLVSIPDIYELNRQKSLVFYPVFIILGCVMFLGMLCNIIVCYVYRCRSRRATSNFFVIFLAIFDLFGCLVGIPLEVSSLALPFIYDLVPLCKIMSFFKTWSVCGQCLTLICVAYDCYGKLCCTEGDFNVKKAKLCSISAVVVAVLLSVPALAVFGVTKVKTSYRGIYGVTCSVDITMDHWLRILYNVCVLGTFVVSLCVMTVLYSLIGVEWCKQRQAEERGEKTNSPKKEFPKKHRFVRQGTNSSSSFTHNSEEIPRLHHNFGNSHSFSSRSDSARVPLKTKPGTKTKVIHTNSVPLNISVIQLHVKNHRQASIFTVISIVFVVNMLPFVVVMILCATTPVFNQFSSNTTEIVFNICIRSYLLNYIVKPLVYIIFNVNFRTEVTHIFHIAWSFFSPSDSKSGQTTAHRLQRSSTMGPQRSTSRTPIYRPPRSSS